MSAVHTVTVEMDADERPWLVRFTCTGTAADICHQWCAEGCEETCYGDGIILSGTDVEPVAQAPLAGHRWEPMPPDGTYCRIVDWLDAAGWDETFVGENYDQTHRLGTHVIDEEWTGDEYVWSYAEAADTQGCEPGKGQP